VQDVLHPSRPHARRAAARRLDHLQATDERIDFDWTALLFILHRSEPRTGGEDYLTVLERLMIPALRGAAAARRGARPTRCPTWTSSPRGCGRATRRPTCAAIAASAERYRQAMESNRVEELLTEAGTRARQANITDQSIPGRRDQDYAFIMGAPGGRAGAQPVLSPLARLLPPGAREHPRLRGVEPRGGARLGPPPGHGRAWRQVPPLGSITMVSHANEQGSLMTRMTRTGPHGFFPSSSSGPSGANGRTWNDAAGPRARRAPGSRCRAARRGRLDADLHPRL
jgi:hypothetical protein